MTAGRLDRFGTYLVLCTFTCWRSTRCCRSCSWRCTEDRPGQRLRVPDPDRPLELRGGVDRGRFATASSRASSSRRPSRSSPPCSRSGRATPSGRCASPATASCSRSSCSGSSSRTRRRDRVLRLPGRPAAALEPAQHLLGAHPPADRPVGRVRHLLDARLLPLDAALADRGGADRRRDELRRPLARPPPAGLAAVLTMSLLVFTYTWNEFLLALVLVSGSDRTRPRRWASASSPARRGRRPDESPRRRCSSRCRSWSSICSCNGTSCAACSPGR